MKLFAIFLAASAVLAGCVATPHDHATPPPASAGDRDHNDRQPNNPPMGY